jgi:TrmH family RNA methyltransferase
MGSLMRLDIRHLELEEFFNAFDGIPIYTAELNGDAVFDITFKQPMILVIGNESKGVSGNISKLATRKIKIPRIGQAESLNAGIATGIILSQITR